MTTATTKPNAASITKALNEREIPMAQASFEDWSTNLVVIVPGARKIHAALQQILWLTLVYDHDIRLKIRDYLLVVNSINSVKD